MTTTKNVQILEIGQPVQYFHNGTQPNMNACLPALIEEVYEDETIRAVAFYRGTSMEVTATVDANDNGRPYIKLIGADSDDEPVLKAPAKKAPAKRSGDKDKG